ncbi:MAG: NFACT RNA binding domain-containing protein [Treponema sp.]|nr:NFACT RNA binding domain-containing protein [Treponema sp.]
MSLNCNEINLILSELNITGAFIQEIVQPGFDTMAFYTYKEGTPKTVLVCTAQNSVRINETRRKITKNDKPLRFMEFCRARIKGCRINSCQQLGVERIIKLELSRNVIIKDKPNEKTNQIKLASTAFNLSNTAVSNSKIKEEEINENYILYIKLWNNAANIILCDENNVILEPMFRRPERNEIKGEVFVLPEISEEKIAEAETKFPVREWSNEETASFNAYIDYWYSEHADNLSRESLLEKAEKWYNINHSKRESALQNLIKKQESFANAEELKHQGDLILTYGHLIKPDTKYLECEDYETGKTLHLMIDPKKSAQENAAEYYKNYKKAISGAEEISHDIEIAKIQLEKLEKQYEQIISEKNPVKIEQMLRKDSTPKQQQKKTHPGLDFTVNGWLIYVGRDANENDELLRHYVRGEDLWLHVRDFPGGYVFIKAKKGKTVPLDILLDAGNLAVYYSKARNAGTTDLYYTHVKYLRRAKNGPKGLVIPTQEKNLCITPDKERLNRLSMLNAEKEI